MNSPTHSASRFSCPLSRTVLIVLALALGILASCKKGPIGTGEYAYVSAPQANLRDRVAAVYNKVGMVKNGERLEILEKQKRFVRVRSPRNEEGWIEQRYLVTEDVFKGFDQLRKDNANAPVQGHGLTRAELNMHLTPGRDTEKLYQLSEGEKVDILRRATAERVNKTAVAAANPKASEPRKDPKSKPDSKSQPTARANAQPAAGAKPTEPEPEVPKVYDDFWLVRNKEGNVGWVLARMIDLDIPLDIAQYAEGQRTQAAFVLSEVQDEDKKVPQYLVLYSEPKDGLPYDFDQARVFSWNLKKHRYETAYRERNFMGNFPVKVGTDNFDKEGVLPTFTLRVQGDNGQLIDRTYKMNGPIVRRVTAPGDQAAAPKALQPEKKTAAKKNAGRAARRHRR